MKTIRPLTDHLILNPSISVMRGGLFVPEQFQEAATSCLVMDRGKSVNPAIKVGDTVLCPVGFGERKNNIIEENLRWFICKDTHIHAIVRNKVVFPLGRRVLIRRDVQEISINGIVIPENRRAQSLFGTIERLGLSRSHFKVNGLKVGLKIRLTEWQPHMIETALEDGSYGLVVNESDILYYEH